jgi:peroxidase
MLIDGKLNNYLGIYCRAGGVNLVRRVPSAYSEGVSLQAGSGCQSARVISNVECGHSEPVLNSRNRSSMVWQWGQFLDHDMTLTATSLVPFPVAVSDSDVLFDPFWGTRQTINLVRSK